MKLRESGLPDESMWSGFFSPEQTLTELGLTGSCRDVVDFGCGYGTFTIPAARIAQGTVLAFDIEAGMVTTTAIDAHLVRSVGSPRTGPSPRMHRLRGLRILAREETTNHEAP